MTVNSLTKSTTYIKTRAVHLNALEPSSLAEFYQTAIGMTLFSENDGIYTLGTPNGRELLQIHPTNNKQNGKTTGLYHLALLLPERSDLGNILRHLLTTGVNIEGASDHGYSEALYLPDLEGNGIEIYTDKNKSDWDTQTDGTINGVVEPMDSDSVLASANQLDGYQGLPDGTVMGHIHLHVDDLESTLAFYREVMGLGVKSMLGPSALFMATNDYHHHLGANVWRGKAIPKGNPDAQGLRASVWASDQGDWDAIKAQLDKNGYDYTLTDTSLTFLDSAGMRVIVEIGDQ